MSGSDSGAVRNFAAIVARTPLAGFPLVNGTPNIITWTSPNDGNLHSVIVSGIAIVASAATGGAVVMRYTTNGVAQAQAFTAANLAANQSGSVVFSCDPNTTAHLDQQTALTVGAVTIFATMLGL
jgi:hypothetical protein